MNVVRLIVIKLVIAVGVLAFIDPCRSQTLLVEAVDITDFPNLRARVLALNADGQSLTDVQASDFTVREDAEERPVVQLDCPPPQEPRALSSVLMIDVSASMAGPNLSLAQAAARAWVDALPLDRSECAIAAFDDASSLYQDFSRDREALHAAVDRLRPGVGTDYNAAFIEGPAAALPLVARGRHERVVVLLTDGRADGDEEAIIQQALAAEARLFAVSLGLPMPPILQNLARRTGGAAFGGITTAEEARAVYLNVLRLAEGRELCTLQWRGGLSCATPRSLSIELPRRGLRADLSYPADSSFAPILEPEPSVLRFGGVPPGSSAREIVKLTARHWPVMIQELNIDDDRFSVSACDGRQAPFQLDVNKSCELTITYTPVDSAMLFARLRIASEACRDGSTALSAGFPGIRPRKQTLRLRSPNGGEQLVVGQEAALRWEGVTPDARIRLEYSTDGGSFWQLLASDGVDYQWPWTVPATPSTRCLARCSELASDVSPPWLRSGGGENFDYARGLVVDDDGNATIAGVYWGRVSFEGVTLDARGRSDIFLAHYNAAGQLVWLRSFGGSNDDHCSGLAIDAQRNFYLCGSFEGSARFGDQEVQSVGRSDIFLAKLDPNADVVWLRRAGGLLDDEALAVAVDHVGNSVVTGRYTGSAAFDRIEVEAAGGVDIFLARYGADGGLHWAQGFGGSDRLGDEFESGATVATDADGGIVAAGWFEGSADFGGVRLESAGGADVFVTRFEADGSLSWAQRGGGADNDRAQGLALGPRGRAYVCGSFVGSAGFGAMTLSSAGLDDVFLACYAADGSPVWLRRGGGPSMDAARSVALDARGRIHVAGSFERRAQFGAEALLDVGIAAGGKFGDIFAAVYDARGELIEVRRDGGPRVDVASAIAFATDGSRYLSGWFENATTLGDSNLTAAGVWDAFLLRRADELILQSDESDDLWAIVAAQLETETLDFGALPLGSYKDSVVTTLIRNSGSVPVRINGLAIDGGNRDDFGLLSAFAPTELAAGANLPLEIRFRPDDIGQRTASLGITLSTGKLELAMSGEGIAPLIALEDARLDFGQIRLGESSPVLSLTLRNLSRRELLFDAAAMLGPDLDQFSFESVNEAFRLPVDGEHSIALRFRPQLIGRSSGRLALTYDDQKRTAFVHLFGEGVQERSRVSLRVEDAGAPAGEDLAIRLLLESDEDISAQDFEITTELVFNSSLLLPVGASPTGRVVNGERRIDLTLSQASALESVVATLPMRAFFGNAEFTDLRLENTRVADGLMDVTTIDGRFTLEELCHEGGTRLYFSGPALALLPSRPQPARGMTRIDFRLIETGPSSLTLYTRLGHRQATLFKQDATAGTHSVVFNADQLPVGIYLCVLRSPSESRTMQFLVHR